MRLKKRRNMFATRSVPIIPKAPEPIETEDAYDDYDEPPVVVRPKQKKGRLPGERLLKKLYAQRQRELIDEKLKQLTI